MSLYAYDRNEPFDDNETMVTGKYICECCGDDTDKLILGEFCEDCFLEALFNNFTPYEIINIANKKQYVKSCNNSKRINDLEYLVGIYKMGLDPKDYTEVKP